jgi:hypothetical protein
VNPWIAKVTAETASKSPDENQQREGKTAITRNNVSHGSVKAQGG